jgi:uncharacterized protein (TIGR03083 family)
VPPTPPILSLPEHGEGIGDAASVMRANAAATALDTPVPTCPGWSVLDLVAHQGMVHRWATAVVTGAESRPATEVEAEARAAVDVLGWLDDGLVDLLNALGGAPADLEVFFFLKDAPPPRDAWARRQCHETTIHAVDAMAARLGRPPTAAQTWLRPNLAADGIDELLTGFLPRRSSKVRSAQPLTVQVRTSDTGHAWSLRIGEEPTAVSRLPGDSLPDADVTLTGTAAQLYLGLWNRGEEFTATGRTEWVAAWREQMRVVW